MTSRTRRILACAAATLALVAATPAQADNCGAPDDCTRAPENISRTTSLALIFTGGALAGLVAGGGAPVESAPEGGEETVESMDDIFGPADAAEPTDPAEPGQPEPPSDSPSRPPPFMDRPLGDPPGEPPPY